MRLAAAALSYVAAQAASLSCGQDVCFAGGLSSGAVLQRAPAQAALYGSVPSGSANAVVTLIFGTVDGTSSKNYTSAVAADLTWKVLLDPQPAGGNYSARVLCTTGCSHPKRESTITDLTYGDVVFCAGQSNMWRAVKFSSHDPSPAGPTPKP